MRHHGRPVFPAAGSQSLNFLAVVDREADDSAAESNGGRTGFQLKHAHDENPLSPAAAAHSLTPSNSAHTLFAASRPSTAASPKSRPLTSTGKRFPALKNSNTLHLLLPPLTNHPPILTVSQANRFKTPPSTTRRLSRTRFPCLPAPSMPPGHCLHPLLPSSAREHRSIGIFSNYFSAVISHSLSDPNRV
jgi:hypothetical protein